jgi:hypothetical protein
MANASSNSKAVTPPKSRPTSSQTAGDSNSVWQDRWITIQWALVGVAAVGLVVLAFYLSGGQDTTPVHSR